MKVPSFLRLFGKGSGRRESRARTRERRTGSRLSALRTRLLLDHLEDRTLLAQPPVPNILGQTFLPAFGDSSNSVVAVDPLDPQRAVAVWVYRPFPQPMPPPHVLVQGAYTTNAGQVWSPFTIPGNLIDPGSNPMMPVVYDHATMPSIGFDRNRAFYVTYAETNNDAAAGYISTGAVVLHKFDMTGGVPIKVALPGESLFFPQGRVLYRWRTQDSAVLPTMVVDNTVPFFTDPDTGRGQSNPSAGTIYVAFGSQNTAPANTMGFNPNVIRIMASSDGGRSWGAATYPVQSFGGFAFPNFGSQRWGTPRLTVSQGSIDGRVQPGQVLITWDDFGQNNVMRADDRRSFVNVTPLARAVGLGFTGVLPTDPFVPIVDGTDPGGGGAHIPGVTTIPIIVNLPANSFATLGDIEVTLSITHQNLSDLNIQLISPDGRIVTLVNNRTTAGGQARMGIGITGNNLGWENNITMGTVFDRQAARRITEMGVAAPYQFYIRPEGDFLVDDFLGLDTFIGNGIAQLNGTWLVRITDFRQSPPTGQQPPQAVRRLEINFGGGLTPLTFSRTIFTTLVLGANLPNPAYPNIVQGMNPQPDNPAAPAAYPDVGFCPCPVLASDNTLGSFSPYQGRLYLAFTDFQRLRNAALQDINPTYNTDIYLSISDDGGLTWTFPRIVNDDNGLRDGYTQTGYDEFGFTLTGRPQFMPEIAVDQTTGSLVMSWRDARDDAAKARVATYMTYSVDGGTTFSPNVYVSQPYIARDAVTGRIFNREPLSDSQSAGHPAREGDFGFGIRMGLAVVGGQVYSAWSSNQNLGSNAMNAARLGVQAARATIPAGPRIVASTQGVVRATIVDGQTFNAGTNPDGTPRPDGFVIEFDRPVSPVSFTTDQVKVIFRTTTTPATAAGVALDVLSVLPLNAGLFGPAQAPGATRFLVRFDPAKALTQTGTLVGTYSYAILPGVSDRIRQPFFNIIPFGSSNFTAQPPEINLRVPPTGTGGTGTAQDITNSRITAAGIPANQVITKVRVNLTINHTFTADLVITLIAPDGTRVLLSTTNGGGGQNYTNTTFDDDATTPIFFGFAPFTGSFRPEMPLANLIGKSPNGVWTLEIRDQFAADIGTLVGWSLFLETGVIQSGTVRPGNRLDQNLNATPGEDPGDVYAIPRPLNGTPFLPPYDQATLPLIVPGPSIVSTRVPGQPATADNLVLNGTVNEIEVVFDRDIDPASFTGAQVLRLMGPAGPVAGPFTVTANPTGTDPALARRTFRVGIPQQRFSGTYVLTLGSGIRSSLGDAIDVNQNAGLDVLRDTASVGSTNAPINYTNNAVLTLQPQKTQTSTISIPENYVVQGATLQLNIQHANVPDLTATLIAPDGAEVRLFTRVGNSGTRANFTNTVFDDAATVPIQLGSPPFNGSFNPQQPMSRLRGRPAGGTWTLRITNDSASVSGTLRNWTLTLFKAVPNTGLGEPVADQATVSFRIFTMSNANPQSRSVWTAVGPAPIVDPAFPLFGVPATTRSSRIGGIALDSSDPTGNTMYVAGASGGVWKTTNFLTTDPKGPTYIPLTDFGPAFGANIGGVTVTGRNGDTRQSVVFAATGEGDDFSRGVGFLRSLDGGATWTLQDSTVNADANGNPLPINSSLRDHRFVGSTSFKIVADPKLAPNGEVIVYAALSDITLADRQANRTGGIWRSLDSGRTWTRMRAGQATDVVLSPQSASQSTGNLQVVFGAFEGEGVFLSPNQGGVWNLMSGTVGVPLIRQGDFNPPISIAVNDVANPTPNGPKGRISIAAPEATGNRILDVNYASWLYAIVTTPAGGLDGIYVTKDFGQTWTHIRVPYAAPRERPNQTIPLHIFPSNDPNDNDNNLLLSGGGNPQGSYDMSIVVDPTNPEVVYVGGADGDGASRSEGRLIRVDTSRMFDAHCFCPYSNQLPDGGSILWPTAGPAVLRNVLGLPFRFINPLGTGIDTTQITNLVRDPDNPFLNDAQILLSNVTAFNNNGINARWPTFTEVLEDSVDQHRAIAFRDPVTGKARLVFGDDQGIFSGIDNGDGTLMRTIGAVGQVGGTTAGGVQVPTGSRNGNLQITQFYYGASQPSVLAAEIAQSLFYGTTQDNGAPKSVADVLRTGNLAWRGIGGDGTGVATDQTGSGTAYTYMWPCCGGDGTNFFQVTLPGTDPNVRGIGRTFGLLQQNQPGITPDPQWPQGPGAQFTVNPLSGNQIIIGSLGTERGITTGGKVFRTRDQAATWFQIADTTDLDGTQPTALAYGAPDPAVQGAQGNLDDFIYVGTFGGRIFVTFVGGGSTPGVNNWIDISAGLDGSTVEDIVTNPLRGNREAYAVTTRGVYYMADSRATGASWQNITGNLLNLTHNIFGDINMRDRLAVDLHALVADWRYALPNNGQPGPKFPVLYVGGEAGVFRSIDKGRSWTRFPDTADGAPVPGGFLPNANVTDLQLALGNINPTSGRPDQSAGFNILYAVTYGRGAFAIRLPEVPGITPFAGPRVVSVNPGTPVSPGFNTVTLVFSGPVDPETFTPAAIRSFVGPNGNITVAGVQDQQDPVTRQPPHNTYRLTFLDQINDGVYTLVLGPEVTDFGGNRMDQNGNSVNGEEPNDRYTVRFAISTSDNGRFITGLFNEVLLRRSDTEGFLQFLNVVDAARAQALGPIAQIFVASAEGRARLISQYYATSSPTVIGNFLRRPAAAAEISAWVSFLQAGGTPQQVVNIIVGSTEYYQKAGGTNLNFLLQSYQDVLGRPIDAAGRDGFLNTLAGLAVDARRTVLDSLNRSQEYFEALVRGLYNKYLGHGPTAADVGFWAGQLAGGLPAERVIAAIVGSAEYYQNKGGTDAAWADAAFLDILGRPADAGGRAFLLDQLAGGATRDVAALGLLFSDEYRGVVVRGYYSRFLGRTPGQAEVDAWVAALRSGLSDEQVMSQIASSVEYYQRTGGTDPAFVDQAYLDVLGRAADAAGRANAITFLANSQVGARTTVVAAMTASSEYLTRVIVTTYQTYLRRGPGAAEINLWLPLLASPAPGTPGSVSPQEQFVTHVVGSGEFFQLNGNTIPNWVGSLYTNVLGRGGSAQEINGLVNATLDFFRPQRFGVSETIATSTEGRRALILNSYSTLLRRSPLDQEIANWLNLLQGGLREEQMIAVMVGSAEYFLRQANNDNTTWLDRAYQDLLGRARGASETALLTPLLGGQLSRQQVTDAIIGSVEYRRKVVNEYFRTYLGREGSLPEIDVLVNELARGARQTQVQATVLASSEYYQRTHPYP